MRFFATNRPGDLAPPVLALVRFSPMNARTQILLLLLVLVLVLGVLARMPPIASAGEEQALIATIKLRSGEMGGPDERARIVTLENQRFW
jgi:hypothetical protein